jgi:hypothetical protein
MRHLTTEKNVNKPPKLAICDGLDTKILLHVHDILDSCIFRGDQLFPGALTLGELATQVIEMLRTDERANMFYAERRFEMQERLRLCRVHSGNHVE